jgi:transcriptional regulator
MYRPPAYAVDDIARLHPAIRARRFATIAAVIDGNIQFAYAPMVLDAECGALGAVRFHLARINPMAELDGVAVRLSFLGPDAYVSPDWYDSPALVPTWNYVAIEAAGRVRRIDDNELRQLLVDLSAQEEAPLAPKRPWTLDKVPEDRIAALLNAIRGFELKFESLEGKFKLSQDKSESDFTGAANGLEARADAGSLAVATAMRTARNADS